MKWKMYPQSALLKEKVKSGGKKAARLGYVNLTYVV